MSNELPMQNQTTSTATGSLDGLVSQSKMCRDSGMDPVTAWRYAQKGWLKPVKIANRVYYFESNLAEFRQRAAAGEFAKRPSGCAAIKHAERQARLAKTQTAVEPQPA